MTATRSVPWPPARIRTTHLELRAPDTPAWEAVRDLFPGSDVGTDARTQLQAGEPTRQTTRVPQHRAHLVVERGGELLGAISIVGLRTELGSQYCRPDLARYELSVSFLPEAWSRGFAVEACSAVLMQWREAFPDEPLLLWAATDDQSLADLREDCGFSEVDRVDENGVGHRASVLPPRGHHLGETRRVLLPAGIPSPGKWAYWGDNWFTLSSSGEDRRSVTLSVESTRPPGPGWRSRDLNADGWRQYSRTVPREEIEACETVSVAAAWRGVDINLLAVDPDGKASGWAEPSTYEAVTELMEALDAAGHSASLVEYRVMEVVIDAAELHDFHIGHEADFTDRFRERAGLDSPAGTRQARESPSQGRNYRSVPALEREALAHLLSHVTDLAPPGSERIEIAHMQVSSTSSTSMTALVAGDERPVRADSTLLQYLAALKRAMYLPGRGTWIGMTASITPDGCTDLRFSHDSEPVLDADVAPGVYAEELYLYPRAAEHIPTWWLADL